MSLLPAEVSNAVALSNRNVLSMADKTQDCVIVFLLRQGVHVVQVVLKAVCNDRGAS